MPIRQICQLEDIPCLQQDYSHRQSKAHARIMLQICAHTWIVQVITSTHHDITNMARQQVKPPSLGSRHVTALGETLLGRGRSC